MKNKMNKAKVLKNIILISAILFAVLGIAMMIIDLAFIKGAQYLITAVIYGLALKKIKDGELSPGGEKDKKTVNFNLGFIFSVIGITSPLGSPMFTMWLLGMILFLIGMFHKKKEEE
ncbi:MAG: hypothetical protein JXR69_10285 [Candidatus Delongbacteria bacterium]|nr:hypothetical protein [Candidatus Delongbacteria bacterium]